MYFHSSAADHDASKHEVDGDAFIRGRAAFRDEFGGGSRRLSKKEELDNFTQRVTRLSFKNDQDAKKNPCSLPANAIDKDGKPVHNRMRPSRALRQSYEGQSYEHWTDTDKTSGGGSVLKFFVILTIVMIIVRKMS